MTFSSYGVVYDVEVWSKKEFCHMYMNCKCSHTTAVDEVTCRVIGKPIRLHHILVRKYNIIDITTALIQKKNNQS